MKLNSPIVKFTLGLFGFFIILWFLRNTDPPKPTSPPRLEVHGQTMGTTYKVVLSDPGTDLPLEQIKQEIDQRLAGINQVMSTYIQDSELSKFNQSDSTEWLTVSSELLQLIQRAQAISLATEGAFDITIGPAVNLWQFGPQASNEKRGLPSEDAIERVRKRIGYQHLHVDKEKSALRKDFAELYIDLSAIAKGYAVDEIIALLKQYPIEKGYMVEIGGEIRTEGVRADSSPWKIGIQQPDAAPGTLSETINLSGQAMATSGDYFNFFEVNGVRYSHTIDPSTGRPVTHTLTSSVVITKNCAEADAWATALLVLGPDKAYDIAMKHNLAVMLFDRIGTRISSQQTPAFNQAVVKE